MWKVFIKSCLRGAFQVSAAMSGSRGTTTSHRVDKNHDFFLIKKLGFFLFKLDFLIFMIFLI